MNNSPVSLSRRGFSLIELIVVIAIIAIIAGFTVPQAGQILKGSTLTQGSTILTDQIRLAREYALTKNSKVEVRFYQYGDPETPGESVTTPSSGQYRAMQIFQVLTVTATQVEAPVPLDKVQVLPQGVIMELGVANSPPPPAGPYGAAYSTILANPNSPVVTGPQNAAQNSSLAQLPRGVGYNYNYVSFRFLQDGSTTLAPTGTVWYMTLHNINDKGYLQQGGMPFNYFCLQIDPVVGTTKPYRPQAG